MTNDQVRKLLGGYATNSLTEAERKALFEAALDDQDLFDTLQQEQALKELLADPVSRNQIQQALAEPPVSRAAGAGWRSRRWAWGGVAGAVAATVLIIAVIQSNEHGSHQVARVTPPAQISGELARSPITTPAEPTPKQQSPAPRKAVRAARVLREPAASTATDTVGNAVTVQPPAASAPPPPPPQAVPATGQEGQQSRPQQNIQVQAGAQQVQTFPREQFARDSERPQAARALSTLGGFAGVTGSVANYKGPLLQYSLVKREPTGTYSTLASGVPNQPGDALRLTVFPGVAGYLTLYQLDPAGDWKRLFPAADQGLLVAANATQTIPDSPIVVTAAEQKLRLILVPTQPLLSKENAAQTKAAATPLVVDITIGPGRVP